MTFSLEIATRGAPQIYDSLDVYISSRYRILIPRLDLYELYPTYVTLCLFRGMIMFSYVC